MPNVEIDSSNSEIDEKNTLPKNDRVKAAIQNCLASVEGTSAGDSGKATIRVNIV